ncbi:MAG: alpha/beta hydrolase [Bacteroidales bacterium]|nr:alpha/beta hydrolase [Bacteroidales bacterium]
MNIEINNKNIFYEILNQKYFTRNKPIIVFLHEGLGCSEQWKEFPQIISDKLKLPALLYDRYGHGKSEKLREERDIFYLHNETHFLHTLLNNLKINNQLIIFGHSDGGTIALLYASFYPEKVMALITEAHHVFVEKVSQLGVKMAVEYYKNSDMHERMEKYHGENTESMFFAWANTWLAEGAEKYDILDEISKIDIPILTFQGENDQYGTYKQIQAVIDNCKNSKVEVHWLKECGHAPHKDQEDYVIEKIVNFVSDNT